MQMEHPFEADTKVKHVWMDGGTYELQEWNNEAESCAKEEIADMGKEVLDIMKSEALDMEDAMRMWLDVRDI